MRNEHTNPIFLFLAALLIGCWGDVVFRADGVGINVPLWFLAVVVAMVGVTVAGGSEVKGVTVCWLVVALLCALVPALRASGFLAFISVLAALLAIGFAGLAQADFKLGDTHTARLVHALLLNGVISGWGFFHWIPIQRLIPSPDSYRPNDGVLAFGRGIVISTPVVVVFLALFASADAQYESILINLTSFDMEWIISHGFVIAFFAWAALAMLVFFSYADKFISNDKLLVDGKRSFVIELIVVVAVVSLVFASYVYIQLGYLFGGVEHITNTPNLTVAEYARRGFFESVVACGIVLVLIQMCGEYIEQKSRSHHRAFASVASVLSILSLIVVASAYQRIIIYTDIFGLTQDRFYVYVGLTWITLCFTWLFVTFVLPLRRQFIAGAVGLAYACFFATALVNPDGFVAWTNLKRLEVTETFDSAYVHQLSADAVPVLVRHRGVLEQHHNEQGAAHWAYVEGMRSNRHEAYQQRGIWAWNLAEERSIRSAE